jgi:hypothetical protein
MRNRRKFLQMESRIFADLRVRDTGAAAVLDHPGNGLLHRASSQRRVVVEIADELAAQHPHVAEMFPGSRRLLRW